MFQAAYKFLFPTIDDLIERDLLDPRPDLAMPPIMSPNLTISEQEGFIEAIQAQRLKQGKELRDWHDAARKALFKHFCSVHLPIIAALVVLAIVFYTVIVTYAG